MSWVRAGAAGEWHKVRERAGEYVTCACDVTVYLDENAEMIDVAPDQRAICSNYSNEDGNRGQGCGGRSGIEDVPDAEPVLPVLAAVTPPPSTAAAGLPAGARCARKNCGKRARTWHLTKPATYYCADCAEVVRELAEADVCAPLQPDPIERLTAACATKEIVVVTLVVRGVVVEAVPDDGGVFQLDIDGREVIVLADEVVAVTEQP